MGQQNIIVCAYYTPDYAGTAAQLKETLAQYHLRMHLEEIPAVSNWEAGTRYKPEFILKCLRSFPELNILYLDADARVRSSLSELENMRGDIALHFRPMIKGGRQILRPCAGTVYVRNNAAGYQFAEAWYSEATIANPEDVDEDCLMRAFTKLSGVTFTQLPETYCRIFDRKEVFGQPIIEHMQASRGKKRLRQRGVRSLLRFFPF